MDAGDYRALFTPSSIAVVGASNNPLKLGYTVYQNLKTYNRGSVFPINPREERVQGDPAYPRVADVPGMLDLVIVTVPRPHVAEAVKQAGEKGARVAIVITAGYSETGPEGAEEEKRLVEAARRAGVRIVGPNCVGVMNLNAGLNATFIKTPPRGGAALLSQSGALAAGLTYIMETQGGGLSKFASLGNMADLSFEELLPHLARDPEVRVIGLYVEGLKNGQSFLDASTQANAEKPLVVLKGGRTTQGARAAGSHTGSLAGQYRVFKAAMRQARALLAEDMGDFLALLQGLEQPLPQGRRTLVLTNAGGPGVLTVDELAARGLELPLPSPETVEALRRFLPPAASLGNPVDMVASARGEDYRRAVLALLRDPGVDMLIVVSVVPTFAGISGEEHARGVVEAVEAARSEGLAKPVLPLFMGGRVAEGARRILRSAGLPVFETPRQAAVAAWGLAERAGVVLGAGD